MGVLRVSARSRSTAVAGAIAGTVREICIPIFTEVTIEGQERTAMKLIVEPR
jgi:stage V sporulation protein SpoVS